MRSLVALLLFSAPALAQVYSWTDAQGQLHYTNTAESIPAKAHQRLLLPADPPQALASEPSSESKAPAAPSGPEAEILASIDRHSRLASEALRFDVAHGPSFLHLAQTSRDPVVITAALNAIATLYWPDPNRVTVHVSKGQVLRPLRTTDEVREVALAHLSDTDPAVRAQAARVAGASISSGPPNEEVIAALADRIQRETDLHVLEEVRIALWSCECGRPELVDAALSGTSRADPEAQYLGLAVMARARKDGRAFDARSLARMSEAARALLDSDVPMVRAEALRAWSATTDDPPEAVRQKLLELATRGDQITRQIAVSVLADRPTLSLLPVFLRALDDTEVKTYTALGNRWQMRVPSPAEAAVLGMRKLSLMYTRGNGFDLPSRSSPFEGAVLDEAVSRAREWARANADALKRSR